MFRKFSYDFQLRSVLIFRRLTFIFAAMVTGPDVTPVQDGRAFESVTTHRLLPGA